MTKLTKRKRVSVIDVVVYQGPRAVCICGTDENGKMFTAYGKEARKILKEEESNVHTS